MHEPLLTELFRVAACHKKTSARMPGPRWASGADLRRNRLGLLVYPGRKFSKLFML